jgi:hypothetical protein
LKQRLTLVGALQLLGDLVAVEVFATAGQYCQQYEADEPAVELFLEFLAVAIVHLPVL